MKSRVAFVFVFLCAAGLAAGSLAWARHTGGAVSEYLDQAQPLFNYGFVFNDQTTRWQEFRPTCNALSGVELVMTKYRRQGNKDWPGNAIVEIRTLSGTVLAQTVLLSTSIASYDWNRIAYSPTLPISAGERYRIAVYSDRPSTINAWIAWDGSLSSTYPCTACLNDVITGWPSYDYAFRTYCRGTRTFLPVVMRDAP